MRNYELWHIYNSGFRESEGRRKCIKAKPTGEISVGLILNMTLDNNYKIIII